MNKHIKTWECSICGALMDGDEAPEYCLLCLNENVFFIKTENEENENEIPGN